METNCQPPPDVQDRTVFVEGPSGERFEAAVPLDKVLKEIAADFFKAMGWPLQDERGRGQRAVVELVNPENPDDTRRLDGNQTVAEADVRDGDTLRIFPEAIAGGEAREAALIRDHREMEALKARNPTIEFKPNLHHAPDVYVVTFNCRSFVSPPSAGRPVIGTGHKAEVVLGQDYPRTAPSVTWKTRIFHPNIHPEGAVCLGILRERYLPGLGLARIVQMLGEMVQYRNFDAYQALNRQAAEWAADPDNARYIEEIGGYRYQGPVEESRPEARIHFRPVSR